MARSLDRYSEKALHGRLQRERASRQMTVDAARHLRRGQTPSEALLWQAIRNRQLIGARFRRQHPIGPFVVDFCCTERKVIIEIDGAVHANQQPQDQHRQELLEGLGYHFVRVSADDVEHNLTAVLETIAAALKQVPRPITKSPSPAPRERGI